MESKNYAVIFLVLCSLVFGSDVEHGDNVTMTGDGATFSMTANSQTADVKAHPSATESYTHVLPAIKGTAGQAMIIDNVNAGVMTMVYGIPSPVDTHEVLGPGHSSTETANIVQGDILYGFANSDLRRLAVGTALGGTSTGVFGHDGTDVGYRTLAQIVADMNTALDLEYLRLDTTNDPLTGDLDFGGNDILSSGALGLIVSGDIDDYLSISTVGGIPQIKVIGNEYFIVTTETATMGVRYREDATHFLTTFWSGSSDNGVLGSTHSLLITSGNNEDITLAPDGTGEVNITTTANGIFPTASSHLATKEYVDSAITFIEEYYFTDTVSDIGGIYFDMEDMPSGEAESTHTITTITNADDQPLVNFATVAGVPGLITLDMGIYSGNIHALKSAGGQRSVKIYYEIHTRATDTTETLLVTSEESDFLTVADEHYVLHATLIDDVSIAATDRIIVKWFANGGTGGGNATVLLHVEGDTAARLNVPISSNVLSQIYLRQDGTKELTANWDAGPFDITADNLIVDSATPILVLKDNDSLGAASVGYIEWRDSGGGRAGFLGNNTAGDDGLLWKNEQGGDIGIQTTGAGKFQIFAETVLNGDVNTAFFNIENIATLGGGVDPAAVTDLSPAVYWRFENDILNTVAPGTNDLQLDSGSTNFETRGAGAALKPVTGTAEYSATDSYKGVTGTAARSLSFWVNTTNTTTTTYITIWGDIGGGGQDWQVGWVGTTLKMGIFTGAGNKQSDAIPDGADGNWHHIAITMAASADMDEIIIYVDGVVSAGAGTAAAVNTAAVNDVTVAHLNGGNNFDGLIDELAIFTDVLTPTEVTAIYKAQRTDCITLTGCMFATEGVGFYGADAPPQPDALTPDTAFSANTGDTDTDTQIDNNTERLGELEIILESMGILP